jgi:ribosomal protein S18 acetylase RimI-like enzyme
MGCGNGEETVIRRAEAGDAAALDHLGAGLLETHYGFDPHRFLTPDPHNRKAYTAFLLGELRNPNAAIFVAVLRGEIVGYVYAGIEERSLKELRDVAGFIHDVAVAPVARRRGLGKQLVETAVAYLREHGMSRVILWTAERNATARRLFESLGFTATMSEMTLETR